MGNKIELGSEFNLSLNSLCKIENNLIKYLEKYNVNWYEYGRTAIRQIHVDDEKIVLLPEFICESVTNCFKQDMVRFYKIRDNFDIDFDSLCENLDNVGTIFICHYFGYLQSEDIVKKIRKLADDRGIVLVEDFTQSLFSFETLIGDYGIASIRKWMKVSQGGILFSNRELPDVTSLEKSTDNSRAYGMILKDMFLKDELDANEKYRQIFTECENRVDTLSDVKRISDFAFFAMQCVDIGELVNKRKENGQYLLKQLAQIGLKPVKEYIEEECPLAIPLRVKNRDAFRTYMIENRVYCAVHWPFDGIRACERPGAKYNADTLISLPIDQRYGKTEIDYMIEVIKNYGGELLF